ncbi:CIC11C00000001684 [Sungouiella intermedia]|uniref:CIC11C00000001684 n=1 Tax=Sungouiella intermedia TaxID=45354 RepID=A0A1L0BCJ6_9ASCO|nr:CIC11C00000001684 [[Candida] intermedia]
MFKSVFKTGIRGIYNVSDNLSFQTDSWSVYPAKHKLTGKVVSVFIFDKTKFETLVNRICSQSPNTKNPKLIISECYELVKYEVSQLTKLKHPQILTIIEVLEETKLKFLFVSEPVVATLNTLDLNKEDELSIQKGLLEISKGLQFLHNYCSIVHLNLQPQSVFVNAQGDWKLAGFKFLQNLNDISSLERENFYIMNNSSVVPFANLNVNFTAPELIVDSAGLKLGNPNDIWSLGVLIFFLYNKGEYLIDCFDNNSPSDFKDEFRKFQQKFYNHHPSELRYLLKGVPQSLWLIMTQLLARYPNDRISIDQFIDSEYFNGSLIKMMWFIDEFSTKTIDEKLVFLEGLLNQKDDLLSKLPTNFKNSKLLPLLVEVITSEINLLSNTRLTTDTDKFLSASLMVVLRIGQDLSSLSFQDRIYEPLLNTHKSKKSETSTFTKLSKVSVNIRLAIVNNTEMLLKKLQPKQVIEIVQELANLCLTFSPSDIDLQANQIQLQDLYLKNLELVAGLIDFPYMKNTLFPLLCQVFKTTTVLSTKLQTLCTFQILIEKKAIDRVIVNEQLLPVLENLKSRDKRIIIHVLQFFVQLTQSEHISLELEILVDRILVQCFRLSFGCNECSKQEFQEFMNYIATIQKSLTERKFATLSEGSHAPATSFDSIINTPLLRHGGKNEIAKTPLFKPMAPSKDIQQKPQPPQKDVGVRSKVKPLTLKPQKAPLSFGATTARSNAMNSTLVSNLHPLNRADDKDEEFDEYQDTNPSRNGNGSSIDWSSARAHPQSQTTHSFGQTLQPQNSPIASGQLTAKVNYPPGFNANLVLTPNSTGTREPKKATNPNDLLDFL